ncbi:uncharacterized protein LOC108165500 [Drosophila miranda]|uniref:uncharacterized protein LOC108165500 n=1 Tax=Drosophila miranda TaxID=7229 RepID=UPI0007E6FDD4|nr:uncharacterized protein LOC108165500 [Drosophila miranda]
MPQIGPIHRSIKHQISNSMSSKFYFFLAILLICAMCSSLGAGRPTEKPSRHQLEDIYWRTGAVHDERLADAEHDSAYELFKLRSKPTTPISIANP